MLQNKKVYLIISVLMILIIVLLSSLVYFYSLLISYENVGNNKHLNNIISSQIPIPEPISYPLRSGYILYTNEEFGYRYQYEKDLINEINTKDEFLKIEGGNFIHIDPSQVKGYQYPGISINVYSSRILENSSVEKWIKKVSTDDFANLSNNHDFKYILSNDPLVINQSEIVFFIDDNPLINGKSAVLAIKYNDIFILIQSIFYPFEKYMEFITDFQFKDTTYRKLTSEDLQNIKTYFNNYETL